MNEPQLRDLILEQLKMILAEQESEEEVPGGDEPDAPSATSVDEQIDALLVQYENLSVPSEEEIVQEIVNKGSLKFILEQEAEEEVEAEVEEEEPAEAPAEEVEDEAEEEVVEEKMPNLDIGTFAVKVARLAEMPEKILDLKDAIINRAVQYLVENYDEQVAKDFEEALMDKFQLAVPEEEVQTIVASDLPAPPAVGAGPGGGGGG